MESEKENNVEVHNKEIKKKDDLVELLKNLNIKSESTKQNLESFSFDLSEDNDFPNGLIFFFKEVMTKLSISLNINFILCYLIIFLLPFIVGLYQIIKIEND